MTPLTPAEIAELHELIAKAGYTHVQADTVGGDEEWRIHDFPPLERTPLAMHLAGDMNINDAKFFAAAVTAMPRALEEIEALRADKALLKDANAWYSAEQIAEIEQETHIPNLRATIADLRDYLFAAQAELTALRARCAGLDELVTRIEQAGIVAIASVRDYETRDEALRDFKRDARLARKPERNGEAG